VAGLLLAMADRFHAEVSLVFGRFDDRRVQLSTRIGYWGQKRKRSLRVFVLPIPDLGSDRPFQQYCGLSASGRLAHSGGSFSVPR